MILGPVSSVKGVGKVFERELQKRGVNTVYDLLYLLPRSYQDRRRFVSLHEIRSGESALIKGRILKLKTLRFKYRTVLEILIGSENSFISARWMGAPQYLFRFKGERVLSSMANSANSETYR